MTDAPERIWAQRTAQGNWDEPIATPYEVTHFSEYIRADVLDARDETIAELVEALEKCARPDTWHAPCAFCGGKIKDQGNYIARAALANAKAEQ